MAITSLQVCMDSSEWLQGTISEEGSGLDSSPITTPTGDEMLTCSRPLIERRLRPQHEQSLKCPRCDSTHTKFCYYNNYSLTQPRYFCKTCRRYWTKGGTLRNIPVGGGCRKNKKVSSKKPSSSSSSADRHPSPTSAPPLLLGQPTAGGMSSPMSYAGATDLQLAFSDQLQFASLHAAAGLYGTTPAYLLHDHPTPIDFMDNKYEALLGGGGGHDGFMSGGDAYGGVMAPNSGFYPQLGISAVDHSNNQTVLERMMLPYDNHNPANDVVEAKPNAKILSLEWHDHQQQACNSDAGKDSFGYNNFGSWTGLMNGYGSSATNPLIN